MLLLLPQQQQLTEALYLHAGIDSFVIDQLVPTPVLIYEVGL